MSKKEAFVSCVTWFTFLKVEHLKFEDEQRTVGRCLRIFDLILNLYKVENRLNLSF